MNKKDFVKLCLELKINISDEIEKKVLKASDKVNLSISPHNNLIKKINVKKSNLNDIFAKLDHLKEDIQSNNFDNKIEFFRIAESLIIKKIYVRSFLIKCNVKKRLQIMFFY